MRWFARATRRRDRLGIWYAGYVLVSGVISWLSKNAEFLGDLSWPEAILLGLFATMILALGATGSLALWRTYRPLPPSNQIAEPHVIEDKADIDLELGNWWRDRQIGQGEPWKSIALRFTTPRPLQNAMAYVTRLNKGRFGTWMIDGTPFKCRLGWPGKVSEQYAPRRIATSEDILFLEYDERKRQLFLHSDAEYTGFDAYAYHPPSKRAEKVGLLPGSYEITVRVESDGGVDAEETFVIFWSGDPDTIMITKS